MLRKTQGGGVLARFKKHLSISLVACFIVSVFLFNQYVNATDVIISTETTISGQINGIIVSGTGSGTFNLTQGNSTNEIIFASFPTDTLIPMYGRSWKCKHHPKPHSGISSLDSYFIETTFVFTGLATGTLYTNGTVTSTNGGTKSEAVTTWSGNYSGPTTSNFTDVSFYETFIPTQNPKQLTISGYREMYIPGEGTVYCNWTGTLTSLEDIEIDEPFTLEFTLSNVSWDPITKIYEKDVQVDIQ